MICPNCQTIVECPSCEPERKMPEGCVCDGVKDLPCEHYRSGHGDPHCLTCDHLPDCHKVSK